MSESAVRRFGAPTRRNGGRGIYASLTVAALVAAAVSGCGSRPATHPAHMATSQTTANDTYGRLPSYLPPDPVRADSVLVGTVSRPALTSQGDAVEVGATGRGSVRATVTGPAVPAEGLPYETPSTACTFTVTLRAGRSSLPVRVADFSVSDHLGAQYTLHVVDPGGAGQPPATLAPGRSTTFQLRASLPTGEGLIRWAPDGRRVVASWDFEVETD